MASMSQARQPTHSAASPHNTSISGGNARRQIEAAREISHTISASANKVFLDSNDLLLNLQQLNVLSKQKK
ncbi:hypothetical protein BDA96_02G105300 [Sorghum bicolor]|uniref:Uncharacterized protein n=1 Tax=Sorghum bicolor TaxID=4558 RepID=A0A921RMQ4_SORBI|nr:hypothetical protein BDA96_02G105300 [Sorghum bicolor]